MKCTGWNERILLTCQKTTVMTDWGSEHRETERYQEETAIVKEGTDMPLGAGSGRGRG